MFGVIFGTLCLIALIATVRRRHHFHPVGTWSGGCHGGWERGPWTRGPGFSRRSVLRALFLRLDTTPGQEKAIVEIVARTRSELRALRGELARSRREIAALVGSELLERDALERELDAQTPSWQRARALIVDALTEVHTLLDTRQRRELGALLADGSFGPALYEAPCGAC